MSRMGHHYDTGYLVGRWCWGADSKQKVQQEEGSWTYQMPNTSCTPTLSYYPKAKPARAQQHLKAQILPLGSDECVLGASESDHPDSPNLVTARPDKDALPSVLPTTKALLSHHSVPAPSYQQAP